MADPSDPMWPMAPFDDRRLDRTSYRFVTRSVAISGDDVEERLENGRWVVVQTDDSGNRWEACHEDHIGAILLLIAERCGVRLPPDRDGDHG